MELNEIGGTLAAIHNRLAEISVKGDDTIRMAEALTGLRQVVSAIANEQNNTEQDEPGE